MATTEKKTNFAFITHDGKDENGNRAEVYVQANKGTIKEIKANEAKQVADVHFQVENLKFPIHGWIRTDNPLYELVTKAYENGDEVTFRIETQRKPAVDRSIPMSKLRETMASALETVKVILVGINGTYSDEMVTNVKEDPSFTGGRYVATDEDLTSENPTQTTTGNTIDPTAGLETLQRLATNPAVRPAILENIASQLLLAGADVDEINQALVGADKRDSVQPPQQSNYAMEAPSWKEYNSDGRRNLGSSIVAAGVGIETLIHDRVTVQLTEAGITGTLTNLDDLVDYYLNIMFAICDRIQVAVYGEGFRPDRGAQSHVRIRGIVYELVKKEKGLPFTVETTNNQHFARVNENEHNEWVKVVGTEGIKRFARSIEASARHAGFKYPRPVSLTNGTTAPNVAETQPVPVTPAQEAPQAPVTPELAPDTQTVATTPEAPAATVEPVQEATPVEEPEPEATPEPAINTSLFYTHHLTEEEMENVESDELATPETLNRFKNTLSELGLNIQDKGEQARIAKLLAYSFGPAYSNARKIPDFLLEELTDHYESMGTEILDQAIREAVK